MWKMQMKKGDCMKIACENVIEHQDWLFCYAYVAGQGPLTGTRIMHAWNEDEKYCFDFSNGRTIVCEKERYYKNAQIQEKDVAKQTYTQVCELMLKTGKYGGWITGPNQIPMKQ